MTIHQILKEYSITFCLFLLGILARIILFLMWCLVWAFIFDAHVADELKEGFSLGWRITECFDDGWRAIWFINDGFHNVPASAPKEPYLLDARKAMVLMHSNRWWHAFTGQLNRLSQAEWNVSAAVVFGPQQEVEGLTLHSLPDDDDDGGDDELLKLVETIAELPRLKHLSWRYTQKESSKVFRELSSFVSSSEELVSYSIYQEDSFEYLSALLHPLIRQLAQQRCREVRQEECTQYLVDSLLANNSLQELNISFNLTFEGLARVLDAIVDSGTIRVLKLSQMYSYEQLSMKERGRCGRNAYIAVLPEVMAHQQYNTIASCANSVLQQIDFGADDDMPNDDGTVQVLCALVQAHPKLVEIALFSLKCPNKNVNMELNWNRFGRPLLSQHTTAQAFLKAILQVNERDRTERSHNTREPFEIDPDIFEDNAIGLDLLADIRNVDHQPEFDSTTLIFRILQDVWVPRFLHT